MDENETVSVSKGVFIYKNGIKASSKRNKRKETLQENIFSDKLWYESYQLLWTYLEGEIEFLNGDMFSSVLKNLVSYIQLCYKKEVLHEIPSAVLLTGINMPDHGAQFKALIKQIKLDVSPHVACLYSQDCQTLKSLVENMINQFVNQEDDESELDDEMNTSSGRNIIKKSQFNFSFLQAWFERTDKEPLVVIIPDFEGFHTKVLHDFVLIAGSYINVLPFVLVFGIATSLSTLHKSFPYQVSSKISVQVFHSQPSIIYLNNILEKIFFTIDCPFQLGGKVFNLFVDIFLFYDLSVTGFIQNIKYAMLEHFCHGNVMALCTDDSKFIKHVLRNFSHEDCENARQILSFRKLVEAESYENRIKLLLDDVYLKETLEFHIDKLKKYVRRLHLFLKCLFILVHDLPKAPLGKQIRELYSVATTRTITKTPEYKECFQLLNFQSKDELSKKLSNVYDLLSNMISNKQRNKLKDIVDELQSFSTKFNTVHLVDEEEIEVEATEVISGQMDRKQLKEKLLGMSNKPKHLNKYEKLRTELLTFLSTTFEEYLVEPSTLYFHEIFFFNDMSIQNHIIGTHRAAIHNALNDPHYYLQCSCCDIPNDSAIRSTMPDICIAYKLHLECGKMINLYDWLQAFLSIVDRSEIEDESKRIVKPELQARFTQAIAELEFLGFIKTSKRKADHVARLTWGG